MPRSPALALTVAFGIGAHVGRANTGGILSIGMQWGDMWAVLEDGEAWRWEQATWVGPLGTLPFPVSQLRFFNGGYAVDQSGSLWRNVDGGPPIVWQFCGQPPGSSAIGESPALTPSTWGAVKARGAAK